MTRLVVFYFLSGHSAEVITCRYDYIREDLKEKDTELTTIGEIVRNRTMWRNFIMASSSGN